MPKTVFKSAKAPACVIKNPVRDLVAFWCLPARQEPGKWVRQPPLANPESRLHLYLKLQPNQLQSLDDSQEFFFKTDKVWLAGRSVPLCITDCFKNARSCGGRSWLQGSRARQSCNRDRILSFGGKCCPIVSTVKKVKCMTNWRADESKLSAQTVEAR